MSGSAWRRRGGEVLELHGLGVDKGEVGVVLDLLWSGGEHAGDDHNRVPLSGHHHAEFGMV